MKTLFLWLLLGFMYGEIYEIPKGAIVRWAVVKGELNMKNLIEARKRLDKVKTKTKKYSYPKEGEYFLFQEIPYAFVCLGYVQDGRWMVKTLDDDGKIIDTYMAISSRFRYIGKQQATEMGIPNEITAESLFYDQRLIEGLVRLGDFKPQNQINIVLYPPNIICLDYNLYYIVIDTVKYVSRVAEAKVKEALHRIENKQDEDSRYAESIINFINNSKNLLQEEKAKLLDAYLICNQYKLLQEINAFG